MAVRGDCQHYVNVRPDGYVVVLSNNEGIIKPSHAPARMDQSQTSDVILSMKKTPLGTEDWIGEEPRPWKFPNEWLAEYTEPMKVTWEKEGDVHTAKLTLRPGEIRVFFIRTQ